MRPLQPPEAMQAVAFWLDQERFTLSPDRMLLVFAEKFNDSSPLDDVGEFVEVLLLDTETDAERVMLPPGPLQVSR